MTAKGIDWSHYQAGFSWPAMWQAGFTFGWGKVNEGLGGLDAEFLTHQSAARSIGAAASGYHFADPTLDPIKCCDKFCILLGPVQHGDLRPVLDLEVVPAGMSRAQVADWGGVFCERLAHNIGGPGIVYGLGNAWWAGTRLDRIFAATNGGLWFADPPPPSALPMPFPRALVTQVGYTAAGGRRFDLDVADDVALLLFHAPPAPPGPPPAVAPVPAPPITTDHPEDQMRSVIIQIAEGPDGNGYADIAADPTDVISVMPLWQDPAKIGWANSALGEPRVSPVLDPAGQPIPGRARIITPGVPIPLLGVNVWVATGA